MLTRLQIICFIIASLVPGPFRYLHSDHPANPPSQKIFSISIDALNHAVSLGDEPAMLQPDTPTCSIPFTLAGKLILVKGRADKTEGNFILDTGAPDLVLNSTYFRDYPVEQGHNESQETITGQAEPALHTKVKWFKLGTLNYYNADADLISLGNIENSKGVKILGLLGVALFRQCELVIDYKNSMIHLHRINKKEKKTYQNPMLNDSTHYVSYPFDVVNNRILIRTIIAGKELPFVIDYAAENNIIDSRLPNKILDSVIVSGRVVLVGAGNKKVEAITGDILNFSLGRITTGNLPVIVMNLENTCFGTENCISGVLGQEFLSRYTLVFNFEKYKLYILNE